MQETYHNQWHNFQTKHGTASNLNLIKPTPPVTPAELRTALSLQEDFKDRQATVTQEQIANEEIKTFIDKREITVSLDVKKINSLKDLIENDHLYKKNHTFFTTDIHFLLPCAFALYVTNRIHNNFFIDLIVRWSIKQGSDFEIIHYFSFLDQNNSVVDEAAELLKLAIELDWLYLKPSINFENIRQALIECGSTGMFYISSMGRYANKDDDDLGSYVVHATRICKITHQGKEFLLHISREFNEILNLLAFGDNAKKTKFFLKDHTRKEIEQAILIDQRWGSLDHPNGELKNVHVEKQSYWGRFAHDLFHGQQLCTLPNFMLQITQQMVSTWRIAFGKEWTREIWVFAERDIGVSRTLLRPIIFQKEISTSSICEYLDTQIIHNTACTYLTYYDHNGILQISPALFFIFMHMVKNKEVYLAHNLDPQQWCQFRLDEGKWPNLDKRYDPIKKLFTRIYELLALCIKFNYITTEDSSILQLVKFKVIYEVILANSEFDAKREEIESFIRLINKNEIAMLQYVSFEKKIVIDEETTKSNKSSTNTSAIPENMKNVMRLCNSSSGFKIDFSPKLFYMALKFQYTKDTSDRFPFITQSHFEDPNLTACDNNNPTHNSSQAM